MANRKLALITGGTKGLGGAIAAKLADNNDLALIYKGDETNAQSILKKLKEKFPSSNVNIYKCDVTKSSELETVLKKIRADFGKEIAILINAAGISSSNLFVMDDLKSYHDLMDVNFFGPLQLCKMILPDMIRNKYGRIINLSTNAVSENIRGLGAYCASKAALEKFSQTLAGEVARNGITVNVIRPGLAQTQMSKPFIDQLSKEEMEELLLPSGEFVDPDEIAKTVLFLIEAKHINGSTVTVDTGHALFKKH